MNILSLKVNVEGNVLHAFFTFASFQFSQPNSMLLYRIINMYVFAQAIGRTSFVVDVLCFIRLKFRKIYLFEVHFFNLALSNHYHAELDTSSSILCMRICLQNKNAERSRFSQNACICMACKKAAIYSQRQLYVRHYINSSYVE